MTKKILIHPHKALRRVALPVTKFDEDLARLAADLRHTMRSANGIGLAAPQVGVSRRVIVVRTVGEGDMEEDDIVAVNPEIVAADGEVASNEGCLSVPGVRATIRRMRDVTVRARLPDGSPVTFEPDQEQGVVFQHEIDHLDGVLFFDHLPRMKRAILMRRYEDATGLGG